MRPPNTGSGTTSPSPSGLVWGVAKWHLLKRKRQTIVISVKAGIQHFRPVTKLKQHWIPAFAGMTSLK